MSFDAPPQWFTEPLVDREGLMWNRVSSTPRGSLMGGAMVVQ